MNIETVYKKICDDKVLSFQEVSHHFKVSNNHDFLYLQKILNDLLTENKITFLVKENMYVNTQLLNNKTKIGTINLDKKNNGYINIEDKVYFFSSRQIQDVIAGDVVSFTSEEKPIIFENNINKNNKLMYYADFKNILKRNNLFLLGIVKIFNQKPAFICDKKDIKNLIISNFLPKYLNKKVKAKIISVTSNKEIIVQIIDVLGDRFDKKIDSISILELNNISYKFNKHLEEQAKNAALLKSKDFKNRKDLTNKAIITIDGDDSKDFDDAIFVEKEKNNYRLFVAIADVSHYVEENTDLNKEALMRSNSIYLSDFTVPMLPEILSNDYCSLNPDSIKLTITCEILLDENAQVIEYQIYKSFIKSHRRCTYNEVNSFFENKNSNPFTEDIKNSLSHGFDLYKKLKKIKLDKGMIDFSIPESKIILEKTTNKVLDIVYRTQKDAEMMIEQFMVLANEMTADFLDQKVKKGIYRIHPKPVEEKLEKFKNASRQMKFFVEIPHVPTSKQIQKIVHSFNDKQNRILTILLLRCMEKAKYDYKNIGHYGLASECYTHFTSPIRRYADLMVHRLITHFLDGEKRLNDYSFDYLKYICEKNNFCEIKAMELESTVAKMKKAEYMQNFIGQTFEVLITSITSFGFFVELNHKPIEGMVNIRSIENIDLIYNAQEQFFIHTKTKRQYRLGDMIKVKLIATNKYHQTIDFCLA